MSQFAKRLFEIRSDCKLSMQALADLASVSKSMISKIESGDVQPTLDVAAKLAAALGTNLSEMLQSTTRKTILCITNTEQSCWQDPQSGIERRSLSPAYVGCKVEFLRVQMPPLTSTGLLPGSSLQIKKKYLYVNKGRLQVKIAEQEFILNEHDSFYFEAKEPHEFINMNNSQTEYLIVIELL